MPLGYSFSEQIISLLSGKDKRHTWHTIVEYEFKAPYLLK